MTSAAPHPQVNYRKESPAPAEGSSNHNNNSSDSNGEKQRQQHTCVVCGDESDGLHFGQFTCRACAAFFRRTVSLKLQYTCKRENHCEVDKAARNMCRACRYQKCLQMGMMTSAVQHARDGIGKRAKSAHKLSTGGSHSQSDTPELKMPKSGGSGGAGLTSPGGSSAVVSSSSSSAVLAPFGGPGGPFIGIQHPAVAHPHFIGYGWA